MATNTASATARFVRVAPNKIRQVAGPVRGSSVEDARRLLRFSPKGAAEPLLKALDSAVANAENVHDLDADELVVVTVAIDEGPTLRRFRPRAMGRAYRIRKRTSHITVTVGLDPQATQRRTAAKKATPGRRGRRSTREKS